MVETLTDKSEFYSALLAQTKALIAQESDVIANMANISALLFEHLDEVNWVGFYRLVDNELVLGPFQGKVACIRIPLSNGVCGAAATTQEVQRVADVHQFSGHIACDASTNAEIVLPVIVNNSVVAVLDIDSQSFSRFDEADQQGLQAIVDVFSQQITKANK